MPGVYGQQTIQTLGRGVRACADPQNARWKAGGVTIDWSTVTAVGTDTTLADGTIVKAGDKYILAGTVLVKITSGGKFGPAATAAGGATAATDGRQTITSARRGEIFILDETKVYSALGSEICGDVFDAGSVFGSRIQMGGTGQPTEVEVEAAFPGITFVLD